MKTILYKYKSEISTFAGLLVAVGTALSTIDFSTFNWQTEWPKVFVSIMIAVGGYVTQIKVERDGN
jgi:uncharacterized integral membrane protein